MTCRIYDCRLMADGIEMLWTWKRGADVPRFLLHRLTFRTHGTDYGFLQEAIKRRLQCKDGLAPRSDCSTTLPRN